MADADGAESSQAESSGLTVGQLVNGWTGMASCQAVECGKS